MLSRRFLLVGLAPLALVTVAATGCSKKESIPSDEVTTKGYSLDFKIMSDGANSTAYVALHVGSYDSNIFATLTSGDNLVLKAPGGAVLPLSKVVETLGSSVKTSYIANTNVVEGTFLVDFTRVQGASALNNSLSLPPGFKLSTTSTGTVSRKNLLTLNWDNKGTDYVIRVEWKGDCIFNDFKDPVGDPGSFTLNSGDIRASGDATATCPVTFRVTRKRITSNGFSAEFGHPSNAEGDQYRELTITSGG